MEAKLASLLNIAGHPYISEEGEDIKELLEASCQFLFNQKVEFVRGSDSNSHLKKLRRRYRPLNIRGGAMDCDSEQTKPTVDSREQDGIAKPKVVLFDQRSLTLQWSKPRPIGAGLANLGNTCFLNSVLQCLTYTPPLINFLASGEHSTQCHKAGFCSLCELQCHTQKAFNGGVVKPTKIVQNLKAIGKHFRLGSQEDAHEFLRYFVDSMQRSCLEGLPAKMDAASKATTLVHSVFGGYLRSRVKCLECMKHSDTFDPMLDLSLDIKTCPSIEKALQKAIHPDVLDGPNQYACPNCKKFSKAEKHFRVHRMPKVLTLHLKRFSFASLFGSKVSKMVQYSEYLNLRPFTSQPKGPAAWYKLYAVLVHSGFSCHSGHYYCFVRNSNNFWYCMNDSVVRQVSQGTVLNQEAYLLLYVLDPNYMKPQPKQTEATTHKSASPQHTTGSADRMDSSTSTARPLPFKKTLTVEVEKIIPQSAVPVKPSKPTGIVNPSPQKLPKAEPTVGVPLHSSLSSTHSLIPLRKTDSAISTVQDEGKSKEKGFVPRNVVLSEKQKKLGVRPLQPGKPPKVQKQLQQESGVLPLEENKTNQAPLLTFVENVNESFDVNTDHPLWTPVQDAVEEVYSSTAPSPAQLMQQAESTSNHASIPKHSVPSPTSASEVATDALSLLPPALRDKQPKVAMVSPTLHAKPVARVLPSVNITQIASAVVKRSNEGIENGNTGSSTGDRQRPQQPCVEGTENVPAHMETKLIYGPAIPSLEQGKLEKDAGDSMKEQRKRKKKKHRVADMDDSADHRSRERLHKRKKKKKKHKHHRDSGTEDARVKAYSGNSSTENDQVKSHKYSSNTKDSLTKKYRTENCNDDGQAKRRKTDSSMEGSMPKHPGNGSSKEDSLLHDHGHHVWKDRRREDDVMSSSSPDHGTSVKSGRHGCHLHPLGPPEDPVDRPPKRHKLSHGGKERVGVSRPLLKEGSVEVVRWDEGGRCSKSALGMSKGTSNTVQQLESLKSWGTMRTTIKSWEGETSTMESQPWERKRHRGRDEWDSEYDKGKVKKVRRAEPEERYAGRNPFQEHQSKRLEKDRGQVHTHTVDHRHGWQRDRNSHKHHIRKHHHHHHHHRQHHHGNR